MLDAAENKEDAATSLPVRGAWVEIPICDIVFSLHTCRSPCGERGLKYFLSDGFECQPFRRSPCGERGLKLKAVLKDAPGQDVAPRAGSVG